MSVFELPTVTLIPNGIHHPPIEDGRLLPNSVKTVDIETYKEETEDEDLLASNIIYDKEEVTIYSKEVSFIKNNSINKIATLDFNSLNRLLETDITNTFNEKHFSNLTDEGDDLFE
ncbi:hypothetical protein [Enterococcus sp. DIV0733a]|uniref:hypothetical protein n=1 Tax=Enterococcus sp. DIV0733a TaxID=2774780 RepID=UPI003F1EED6F